MAAKSKKQRGHAGRPARGQRLLTCRHDGKAGWQHESLLRPGNREIDFPFRHPEIDARQGTDGIHHQERGVIGVVKRPPDRGDIAGDSCCGLVMANENGLDCVVRVRGKSRGELLDWHAFAPFDIDDVDIESVAPAQIDP